jgi:uncharacterized membrane protein YoaK (UPF0700 family)
VAGCINAIGLLGFEHQSISHLSGTATLLGTGILKSSFGSVFHLFAILISFFLGASLSGFLLNSSALKLGRHYDTALFIEALLLFGAIAFLARSSLYGHYMASAACGLQNALATTYSGAIVRTTHVTGIFTDLGIMVGAKLRGGTFDNRKATLFLLIILGFISGGAFGAYLFAKLKFMALAFPASACLVLALWYHVYNSRGST